MKKIKFLLISLLLLFSVSTSFSQDWLGYSTSNYAGINSIFLQPANVVDSRYVVDFNILATDISFGNNYYYLKWNFVKDFLHKMSADSIFNLNDFESRYLFQNLNGKPKSAILNIDIQGPSAMVSITPNDAIGIFTRARSMLNLDNFDEPLAKSIRYGFDDNVKDYYGIKYNNKNLGFQFNTWSEYGLTYGRVLYNDNENFLKAGVNVKVLQGLGAMYLSVKNLNYKIHNGDTFSIYKSDINFGHSTNFSSMTIDTVTNSFTGPNTDYKFVANPSLGFDFGVVYEYRPDYQEHKFDMDGKKNMWRKDDNKYKLKIGLSIVDIGSMKYTKAPNSGNFFADTIGMPFNAFSKIYGAKDLDSFLKKDFKLEHESGSFKMGLPTALSLQVDFNVYKGLYLNFTPYISLRGNVDQSKNHYFTNYTFTPRWESQWFGVYVPISIDKLMGTNVGASFRLGPLVIGSDDLFGYWAGKTKMGGFDIFMAFKIPIPFGRVKDWDHDGVSNRLDKCPRVPGTWEFKGCPDTDGDHIQDKYDSCVDTPGLPEFFGCPDSDGDGIPDKQDSCPYLAGPRSTHGCPDSDNDSVPDYLDQCPNIPGPKANHGCPWPDRDHDGVPDYLDQCPDVPGTIANHGCPEQVIKKEEKQIIKTAFENLEFETGSAVIKKTSNSSLNELAKLLKKKPDWQLSITGYTDNVGDRKFNIALSKKRAQAVADYFEDRDIDEDRFIVDGFGPDKPVADNKTEMGRRKNRRVELKILVNGKPISEQPLKEEKKTEITKKEIPAVAEKGWNFYIILGSYKTMDNAKKAILQWKEKGINAIVVYSKTKEIYYISAGKFIIKKDADELKGELKLKSIDSWINYLESY